jgi:hypothetical protein
VHTGGPTAGQGTVLASPASEQIAHPSGIARAKDPGPEFGDPRAMALAGALCASLASATSITSGEPARLMTGLLHLLRSGQMTSDLRPVPPGAG